MSTHEVNDPWAGDLLNRRIDADFLMKFLLSRIEERGQRGVTRSYVLNLDAPYGHGKSYFLEHFEKQVATEGYLVARVNAWRDDHADDPLLSVIAAIDEAVSPHIQHSENAKKSWLSIKRTGSAIALAAIKGAAIQWMKKGIGEGYEAALDVVGDASEEELSKAVEISEEAVSSIIDKKMESLLDNFTEEKHQIDNFKHRLESFLCQVNDENVRAPLFVLVDEIDRCRPDFAIALLERVKHLFEIDHVIFVIATHTAQLRHAVGAIYGVGFDAERYLLRFFDRTYVFEEPSLDTFIDWLVNQYHIDDSQFILPPKENFRSFLSGCARQFCLGLRDVVQCVDILRTCTTVSNTGAKFEMVALLPLIIGQQQEIMPELSLAFFEKLKLKCSNDSHTFSLNENFTTFDRFNNKKQEVNCSLESLFAQFCNFSRSSLPDLSREDSHYADVRWVLSRFSEEFSIRHQSRWDLSNPPFSSMIHYGKLVRSAGRLSLQS
jgi:hypothetical protein